MTNKMNNLQYIAIGDIHGRADMLESLWKEVESYIKESDDDIRYHIVFVGDYIDRGPESEQVVDFIMGLTPQGQITRIVTLKGNHEDMMLNDPGSWYMNGAGPTLASYGVDRFTEIHEDHKDWFKNLDIDYETDKFFFVHAGLMPHQPISQSKDSVKLWIRDEFLQDEYDFGKIIVHGHTPTASDWDIVRNQDYWQPVVRPNRINIDTGAVFGGKLTAVILDPQNPTSSTFLSVDNPDEKVSSNLYWSILARTK